MVDFIPFPKIARLSRECVITEKIDGTNASVYIGEDLQDFRVGSRTRWINPDNDNYGFARWAYDRRDELIAALGPGHHFGEWWGRGIQRGYNQIEKKFSLFNVKRWQGEPLPSWLSIVPCLYTGQFTTDAVLSTMDKLQSEGSFVAPGYPYPEGVIVYHKASGTLFKKTFEKDEGKGE